MSRLLRIYTSYFRTAAWVMFFGTLFFFFYGAVRTSVPFPSIFWYAVALTLLIVVVSFVITTKYIDVMVADAGLRVANIISSLRMTKTAEQPKSVSIVIPCFNDGWLVPMLAAALLGTVNALAIYVDFLRKGSLSNIELIFVDNGSTDDTRQQLERYFKPLEPMAVIKVLHHKKNRGLVEAERTGIAAATGELVISIHASSLLFPRKSSLFSPAWRRPKPALLETLKVTTNLVRSASNLVRSAFGNSP